MRSTSRHWALLLTEKQIGSENQDEQEGYGRRVLSMSLACSSTFFFGKEELDIIFCDAESVRTFIEISILLHDHRREQEEKNLGTKAHLRSKSTRLQSPLMSICSVMAQSMSLVSAIFAEQNIATVIWHRSCYYYLLGIIQSGNRMDPGRARVQPRGDDELPIID